MGRGKRINWYNGEKPETKTMSNREIELFAMDMRSYYDVSPSGLWGEYNEWYTTEMTIYNDEGEIFAVGKRASKNSWRVRTLIGI